ncbi:MAG: hypothetical protein KDF95_17800, partial [Rhodocyclaceae bacterium]|nr:hypothetical protein [Rhodocyclaceae bacterium]
MSGFLGHAAPSADVTGIETVHRRMGCPIAVRRPVKSPLAPEGAQKKGKAMWPSPEAGRCRPGPYVTAMMPFAISAPMRRRRRFRFRNALPARRRP